MNYKVARGQPFLMEINPRFGAGLGPIVPQASARVASRNTGVKQDQPWRKLYTTLRGDTIVAEFKEILDKYVVSHYGQGAKDEELVGTR